MRSIRVFTLWSLAVLAIAASTPSQALGTDIFTGHTSGRIMRTTPGGASTSLGPSFGYFINMLTMDTDNQTLVALDSLSGASPQKVIRIDTSTGVILGTVYGGAPFTSVQSWLEVDQDGDYLVADKAQLFRQHREHKVGMRLRQIEEFLDTCANTDAEPFTTSDSNQ